MAMEALAGHLECMVDGGDPIPEPSPKSTALIKLREQFVGLGMGDLPEETELYPVPSPNLDMQVKKIAVSFSQYKLDMIDRKAKAAGMTRSGWFSGGGRR